MKKLIIIIISFIKLLSIQSQPYTIDTVISGLVRAASFSFMPNNQSIVTVRDSTIRVYDLNNNFIGTFWNFRDSLYIGQEGGVLGICLDPNFNTNRYVYTYYTHLSPPSIRIVRFIENNNAGTNPVVIFNHIQTHSNIHYGGNLRFGPDGKLYITIGTGANNNDAQLLTTPRGKIIRINKDGSIPTDNPFYDDGNPNTGNDDRIWARGFRNSFDFCFSPINDSLYSTENGYMTADEINFVRKGKNYGWPICEGFCNPYIDSLKQPIITFTGGATGIIIYNGSAFPQLYGKVIFTVFASPILFTCELGNAPLYDTAGGPAFTWASLPGSATKILQGQDGFIYVLHYGLSGNLLRIKPFPLGINNNNIPVGFSLSQNYPNPFNPVTKIKYEILKQSFVTLKIYNALGMEIKTLINENKQTGSYEVKWDGSNYPSGVYFYEFVAGDPSSSSGQGFKDRKKMVLIK